MPNVHLFLSFLFMFFITIDSASFRIVNQCSYTVWPGLLSGSAGTTQLPTTGFTLQPNEATTLSIPTSWSGRIWGRTLCSTDATGTFSCITGDCGSGTIECNNNGGATPTTLAEFTLNGSNGLDFYDVSLVDGYNLPVLVEPVSNTGSTNCTSTGCTVDINDSCPNELAVAAVGNGGGVVACKSACEAFHDDAYCCSGLYANPQSCTPTEYSEFFKNACPSAYSYAFDDGTSTFTCASGADYVITFCTGGLDQSNTNKQRFIGGGGIRNSRTSLLIISISLVAVWLLWR